MSFAKYVKFPLLSCDGNVVGRTCEHYVGPDKPGLTLRRVFLMAPGPARGVLMVEVRSGSWSTQRVCLQWCMW
jgi:hypothetical protein